MEMKLMIFIGRSTENGAVELDSDEVGDGKQSRAGYCKAAGLSEEDVR
jgi:hypothetical protein